VLLLLVVVVVAASPWPLLEVEAASRGRLAVAPMLFAGDRGRSMLPLLPLLLLLNAAMGSMETTTAKTKRRRSRRSVGGGRGGMRKLPLQPWVVNNA